MASDNKLIIVKKFNLFCIRYFIPRTKKIICARRNGIVSNSPKTPIKTKSIL